MKNKLVDVDYHINGGKSKSSRYRNKNKTEIKLSNYTIIYSYKKL